MISSRTLLPFSSPQQYILPDIHTKILCNNDNDFYRQLLTTKVKQLNLSFSNVASQKWQTEIPNIWKYWDLCWYRSVFFKSQTLFSDFDHIWIFPPKTWCQNTRKWHVSKWLKSKMMAFRQFQMCKISISAIIDKLKSQF